MRCGFERHLSDDLYNDVSIGFLRVDIGYSDFAILYVHFFDASSDGLHSVLVTGRDNA